MRREAPENPVHNLNLCLALTSIEVGCARNGWRFIPWGEIIERAPKATRELPKPYHMGGVVPDALFAVEFPEFFACFPFELDISNHGKTEYEEKFARYADLIFKRIYQTHLGMQQRMYPLTLTSSPERMRNMIGATPARNSPFLFRAYPAYGSYQRAPAPAPQLFIEGWRDAKNRPINIGELDGEHAGANTRTA